MEIEKEEYTQEQLDKIANKFNNDDKPEGWDLFFNDLGFKCHRKVKEGTTFKYRTYGTFPNAPADYFAFYRDIDHWKTWDENVEDCGVLDVKNEYTSTLYWAVKFPFPLSSRDYVYTRFAKYYESHKMWVITCKTCEHPSKPPTSKRVRVIKYKMLQALRATPEGHCQTFLETFDDPQLSLPSWVISWVTKTAIPKFMTRLNVECTAYTEKKLKN